MQNSTLTDNQLDQIVNVLRDNKTDAPIEREDIDTSNLFLEEGVETIIVNSDTGENIVSAMEPQINPNVFDITDNSISESDSEVFIDSVKNNPFGSHFTDEDAATMFSLILRYKAGEKFPIYDSMPDPIKKMVLEQTNYSTDKKVLNMTARYILGLFIQEVEGNK